MKWITRERPKIDRISDSGAQSVLGTCFPKGQCPSITGATQFQYSCRNTNFQTAIK